LKSRAQIRRYYHRLSRAWGPQHWWPAGSRFEVIVGAYLTQNTAWTNVERAMANLRRARVLSLAGIRAISLPQLEQLVRPAGYFRQKAARLKQFVAHLDANYGGSLRRMCARPTAELREELLSLNGIGPETADSILLYAANHPVFVVDAYTRRLVVRHRLLPEKARYEEIRALFESALSGGQSQKQHTRDTKDHTKGAREARVPAAHPPSRMSTARRSELAQRYNEMHALIVQVGKHYCHKRGPECSGCPLHRFLPSDSALRLRKD